MAHKKAGGSTANIHDSPGQRLGVKLSHGQSVRAGQTIIRQRGTPFRAGSGVRRGKDDTLYAAVNGTVEFKKKKITNYDGRRKYVKVVTVAPRPQE